MEKKTYLICNNSNGTITVLGNTRIEIPAGVQNLAVSLPANTAKETVSRLQKRYPLLKITESTTSATMQTKNTVTATPVKENSKTTSSGSANADKKTETSVKNNKVGGE